MYKNLGDIAKALNDYKAAEGYYAKALEIGERLAEKYPEVPMLKDVLPFFFSSAGHAAQTESFRPNKKRCCVTMSPWGEGRICFDAKHIE